MQVKSFTVDFAAICAVGFIIFLGITGKIDNYVAYAVLATFVKFPVTYKRRA